MPRTTGEIHRVYLISKGGRRAFAAHLFEPNQDGVRFLEIRPRDSGNIAVRLTKEEVDDLLAGRVIRQENEKTLTAWSIRRLS